MGMADVSACAANDFTKCVGALACYIDPGDEECSTYPNLLFGRNIIDGCGVMGSVLTLTVGRYQGMGDVEYGKIYDICFPPELLRLFGGPSCNIMDMMNVSVCAADGFTKCVGALVCYIDPGDEERKIAYPNLLFDRNIIGGRGVMCSVLTPNIGSNQGRGDVYYGRIYEVYFPPEVLRPSMFRPATSWT